MNSLSDTKIIYVLDDQFNDEILKFDELDDLIDHINESDIIGYGQAMNYLIENDCSLSVSMGLAHDMGCSLESLGSELLATLHYHQMLHESISEVIE